ncbi:hypothetical protein [Bacillus sp. OTU530]
MWVITVYAKNKVNMLEFEVEGEARQLSREFRAVKSFLRSFILMIKAL